MREIYVEEDFPWSKLKKSKSFEGGRERGREGGITCRPKLKVLPGADFATSDSRVSQASRSAPNGADADMHTFSASQVGADPGLGLEIVFLGGQRWH